MARWKLEIEVESESEDSNFISLDDDMVHLTDAGIDAVDTLRKVLGEETVVIAFRFGRSDR